MRSEEITLNAARAGDDRAFANVIEPYRRELRAHCYRMSGSIQDADDLLQESLLRAWNGLPRFEGRSSLRTWLYKVTTSACLDALDSKSARLLPMDLGPSVTGDSPIGPPRMEPIWIEPCPESIYVDTTPTPEARYSMRESVTLAFLVALQTLPAKQRAVLILRDVLGWQATECAELLDLTVAAVNSALQRARDTLASRSIAREPAVDDPETGRLLARYVQAWEQTDISVLVSLLHEDATLAMPPLPQWIRGAREIGKSIGTMVFNSGRYGKFRLVSIRASGRPAFAAYQLDPTKQLFVPVGIHVLSIREGRIGAMDSFLNPLLFKAFGLAETLAP